MDGCVSKINKSLLGITDRKNQDISYGLQNACACVFYIILEFVVFSTILGDKVSSE